MQAVGRWALAWLALWALWLLYQGEWNAIQVYAAASAATLTLLVALLLRRFALPGLYRLQRLGHTRPGRKGLWRSW